MITQRANISTNEIPFGACAFHIHRAGDICHVTGQRVTGSNVPYELGDEIFDSEEPISDEAAGDRLLDRNDQGNPLLITPEQPTSR